MKSILFILYILLSDDSSHICKNYTLQAVLPAYIIKEFNLSGMDFSDVEYLSLISLINDKYFDFDQKSKNKQKIYINK